MTGDKSPWSAAYAWNVYTLDSYRSYISAYEDREANTAAPRIDPFLTWDLNLLWRFPGSQTDLTLYALNLTGPIPRGPTSSSPTAGSLTTRRAAGSRWRCASPPAGEHDAQSGPPPSRALAPNPNADRPSFSSQTNRAIIHLFGMLTPRAHNDSPKTSPLALTCPSATHYWTALHARCPCHCRIPQRLPAAGWPWHGKLRSTTVHYYDHSRPNSATPHVSISVWRRLQLMAPRQPR